MTLEEIIDIALRTGKIVLESGGEISRVEMTINKIFEAYELEGECFIITTGIFLTVQQPNGNSKTKIKKIYFRGTDFTKLELINQFSRDLLEERLSFHKCNEILNFIESKKGYPMPIKIFAAGLLSFTFTFYFDEFFYNALFAGFISMVVFYFQAKFFYKVNNIFFDYLLTSLFAGILCISIVKYFPFLNQLKVMIGIIMLLVPGGTITTAMKDLLSGDIVSSTYKFSESLIIAGAISSGISISIFLMKGAK